MTKYALALLTAASIAGSLCGVRASHAGLDPWTDGHLNLRRRLMHDPRTVVRKPDYARLQRAEAGVEQSVAHFEAQVKEAEVESAALSGSQNREDVLQQQQVQQQQLQDITFASMMHQDLQQMGDISFMRQPQSPQQAGSLFVEQEQDQAHLRMVDPTKPQQEQLGAQQIGGMTMMQQQEQEPQDMRDSTFMSQQKSIYQQNGGSSMLQQQSQIDSTAAMPGDEQDQLTSAMMQQRVAEPMLSNQGIMDPRSSSALQIDQGNESPQSNNRRQLEFIHITKTGGSAIEAAAAQLNIMWGACHFWKLDYLGCTTPDWEMPKRRRVDRMPAGLLYKGEPWHAPPHWVEPNMWEGKDTFVVVRNPYERIVSEYYCSSFGYKGDDRENPEVFNHWLAGNLTLLEKELQGHMLPMHYYVYDEDGVKVVTHILRYENLKTEFDGLMEHYNLPVRMPEKDPKTIYHYKGKKGKTSGEKITINAISPQNIMKINEVYARDFEYFGYPMIEVTPSMSEGLGGSLDPLESNVAPGVDMIPQQSQMMTQGNTEQTFRHGNNQGMMAGQGPALMNQEQIVSQENMSNQRSSAGLTLNGYEQQRLDQDQTASRTNEGQPPMMVGQGSMGMMASAGGQEEPMMLNEQNAEPQDARMSIMSLNSGQQKSIDPLSRNGGRQSLIGQGGALMPDNRIEEPVMGQSALGDGSSRNNQRLPPLLAETQQQAIQGRRESGLTQDDADQQRLPQQQLQEQYGNSAATSNYEERTSGNESRNLPMSHGSISSSSSYNLAQATNLRKGN